MEEAEFFSLHYFLKDQSHSMDALVRNRCEREVLAIFVEIAAHLNYPLYLETYAHHEGGLKEIWKAIGKSNNQLSLIVAVLALVMSMRPTSDPGLDLLEKEARRLEIEKTRLEIEKLKESSAQEELPAERSPVAVARSLQGNGKIAVRRSNYYKRLIDYQKVESVGYMPGPFDPLPVPEIVVPRQDFSRFVLNSDKLPVEVDENALIEIFAPVLTEGGYHWRGLYKGDAISFAMCDHQFKGAIVSRQVQFQNGTRLRCVLNIHRKYDELGDAVITGYSVETVLEYSEGGVNFVETLQGRAYRQASILRRGQADMFDDGGEPA